MTTTSSNFELKLLTVAAYIHFCIFSLKLIKLHSIPKDIIFSIANFYANYISSSILTSVEEGFLLSLIPDGNKHTYELLFRGSEDDFSVDTFHSRCDGKAPTVTIIHTEFNHVFGGFSNLKWPMGNYSWASTFGVKVNHSFLFLLRTQKAGDQSRVPMKWNVNNNIHRNYIIAKNNERGPIFGLGHEIVLYGNCDSNNESFAQLTAGYTFGDVDDKEILGGAFNFKVVDYEVWQLLDDEGKAIGNWYR